MLNLNIPYFRQNWDTTEPTGQEWIWLGLYPNVLINKKNQNNQSIMKLLIKLFLTQASLFPLKASKFALHTTQQLETISLNFTNMVPSRKQCRPHRKNFKALPKWTKLVGWLKDLILKIREISIL